MCIFYTVITCGFDVHILHSDCLCVLTCIFPTVITCVFWCAYFTQWLHVGFDFHILHSDYFCDYLWFLMCIFHAVITCGFWWEFSTLVYNPIISLHVGSWYVRKMHARNVSEICVQFPLPLYSELRRHDNLHHIVKILERFKHLLNKIPLISKLKIWNMTKPYLETFYARENSSRRSLTFM